MRPGFDEYKSVSKGKQLVGAEIGVYRGIHSLELLDNISNIKKLYLVDNYTKEWNEGNAYVDAVARLHPYREQVTWLLDDSVNVILSRWLS